MEVVIAALRGPEGLLPKAARSLCGRATDDLCFGIVAAHVLLHMFERARMSGRADGESRWTDDDERTLTALMAQLADYPDLPDVAILQRLRGASQRAIPDAPPLLLDSLRAMTGAAVLCDISPTGAIAHAARSLLRDSVWCTWGCRPWDERGPIAAIEAFRAEDPDCDATTIARELMLPVRTVEDRLKEFAARQAPVDPASPIDEYTLQDELGHGPRSTVYRATRADGHEVALKIVPLSGGPAQCEKIVNALNRAARRGHRQVIAPEHWGALPGGTGIWLAMERCKGSLLDAVSGTDAPMPELEARRAMLDALGGLAFLHDRKMAHGAIKPANLLVRSDVSVALADPRLTTAWLLANGDDHAPIRPRFAAPEQLVLGAQPQLASDVWSIAATLYFLLTLDVPHDEYAGQSDVESARSNPIIPIRDRHTGVPEAIADCLDRALSRDVQARPGDADSFRGELLYGETGLLQRAALLLENFCFKPVPLDTRKSMYEPRASCRCDGGCGAVWVATKTGEVVRIAPSSDGAQVAWFFGRREARTIYHQHDGEALDLGPVLLIGRDDGALDIVLHDGPGWTEQPAHTPHSKALSSFYLDSWWPQRGARPKVPVADGVSRDVKGEILELKNVATPDVAEGKYARGITAIAVLPGLAPKTLTILVATRYPWLYVIDAADGKLELSNRIAMPSWISWLLPPVSEIAEATAAAPTPTGDATCIVAVSRGGDIVRLSRADLVRRSQDDREVESSPEPTQLPVLATAAMAFEDGVLIGTNKGLLLCDAAHPLGVALPVTRSAVLCLDSAALTIGGQRRGYVTMGTDDGHLRVLDTGVIRALARSRRVDRALHNFPIQLDKAVLAVQIVQPAGSDHATYVMAAVREEPPNDAVRLFHVTSLEDVQQTALAQWHAHVGRWFADRPKAITHQLAAARLPPPRDASAWRYMLADVVLPELRTAAPLPAQDDDIVALACELAQRGDRMVLHRLSDALGSLTGRRIDLVLALSRAIVSAVPHRDDRAIGVIEHHLRELHALAPTVHDSDRARLVAWTRFVRKYQLLPPSFSTKNIRLEELVEQNCRTAKYLDALIYQARLAQRGYDLRWDAEIDEEIARLHVVAPDGGPRLVVAVTAAGGVAVFDDASGTRETLRRNGKRLLMIAPFGGDARPGQLRASAAVCDGAVIRIVLGRTGNDAPSSGLAVVELRRDDDGALVVSPEVTRVPCTNWPPGKEPVGITALEPLPGSSDAFVVGVEAIGRPVGLLRRVDQGWTLDLVSEAATAEPEYARDSGSDAGLAVERVSATGALAVVKLDDAATSFLVVAGSDDGVVRVISFNRDDGPGAWQLARWDRTADAITSVVLSPPRPSVVWGPDDCLFYCYLGTREGDAFALAIIDPDGRAGTAVSRFGRYMAQPLWRELHDSPILAMQIWNTPLYDPRDVLITVTERGRLCVHNHVPREGGFSSLGNYYFRGMRFDRVALPDRVRAVTMIDGDRELVAAGPQGRLYRARLVCLRDSVDRDKAESCTEERTGDVSLARGDLPSEMWARMHHLLAASEHDQCLHDGPVSDAVRFQRKLELCALIRVDGGAIANYALRRRLLQSQPWNETDPRELQAVMRRELARPDLTTPAGVEDVKTVIRMMCRALLHPDPDQLRRDIVAAPEYAPGDFAQAVVVCEVVSRYITHDLANPPSAAARLRASALRELLHVPTLLRMATDDDCKRFVTAAIDSCLADDDHIVRTEALRALSVVLRNVCIMLEAKGGADDRERLIRALFPCKLGSLTWLIERIVASLQRFPSFTRRSPLISGAWPQISVLLMVFRIFPDRTLALCDYLVRAGLDVDVLGLCFRSLRRPRIAKIRSRIKHMYLVPPHVRRDVRDAFITRDEFIARYTMNAPRYNEMLKEMELAPTPGSGGEAGWYDVDDAVMASRLLELLGALAQMWTVRDVGAIKAIANALPPASQRRAARIRLRPRSTTSSPEPLAALEHAVDELQSIAELLAGRDPTTTLNALDKLVELGKQLGPHKQELATLTRPLHAVVKSIIAEWQALCRREAFPDAAKIGDKVEGHKLVAIIKSGENSDVFALDDHRYVIKVLRNPSDPHVVRQFLDAAQLARRLTQSADRPRNIVRITDIYSERKRPAFVMERHNNNLESYLESLHRSGTAMPWAVQVAEQIASALDVVHHDDGPAGRRYHGQVTTTNILVRASGPEAENPVFSLNDFDRLSDPKPLLPPYLVRKYPGGLDDLGRQQWIDVAALALIVYRMLTSEVLDARSSEDLSEHLECVARLARDPHLQRPGAQRVVRRLEQLFSPDTGTFPAGGFLPPEHNTRQPAPRA
jgi:serine/threonine protein kinase